MGKTRRYRIRNEVTRIELGQTETLGQQIRQKRRLPANLYIFTWMEKRVEEDKQRHGWTTGDKTLQKKT